MTRASASVLGLMAALLAATPAWSACMQAEHEESVQGRLISGRFKDAAGRPETAFILRLRATVCLQGSDEFDKVGNAKTIHIFSTKDEVAKRFKDFVGKAVRVRGKPFGAHTAHHHAPIVMDIVDIGPR